MKSGNVILKQLNIRKRWNDSKLKLERFVIITRLKVVYTSKAGRKVVFYFMRMVA